MHKYRTHKCHELRIENVQDSVKLSGWVHRKRDHGQLIFIDLRDHYGLTQVVVDSSNKNFSVVENVSLESVITVSGTVVERSEETINKNLPTGNIEVNLSELKIISRSNTLPLQVNSDEDYGEETRLKYRYLDLRRSRPHSNIILRSNVIQTIRNKMLELGFLEFQTPILTASSPEGARDFLVPSRLNKGKFYALPQAPQQFKQLIMVSGFDKYFQIAPCFRDEDSRADRSPGEFYQLDLEMSYVEQEDVFHAVEPVIREVFTKFSNRKIDAVFPKITYKDSMLKYGNDKPDLRFTLEIKDVTDFFANSGFTIFAKSIENGAVVRGIPGPHCGSRSVADRMNSWAQGEGAPGMGYIIFGEETAKGPIANALGIDKSLEMKALFDLKDGDALFFSCANENEAANLAGKARVKIANDMNATGQMIAALLGWPQATFASKVEISDKKAVVSREVDGGIENIEVALPAVISTDLRLNEPRYASLPNIMKAKKKPINQIQVDELNLKIEQRLDILKVEEPTKRQSGIMLKTVEELVDKLKNEAKVI